MRPSHGSKADMSVQAQATIQQRYYDSPKDDRDRLMRCWGYTDCGDCHRSEGFCGWCAIVSSPFSHVACVDLATFNNLISSLPHVSRYPEILFPKLSLYCRPFAMLIFAHWGLNGLNCGPRGWDVKFLLLRFLLLLLLSLVR